VVLQQQWEISRRYAMFATPIAYLIDEAGIIAQDVVLGVAPILTLADSVANVTSQPVVVAAAATFKSSRAVPATEAA